MKASEAKLLDFLKRSSQFLIPIYQRTYSWTEKECALFEAFRKEVLALDPCVTEEFLKYYVAYKAETNFVDVYPQSRRLRLTLNMAFAEINDPKDVCKDISGHRLNGDVQVGLASIDDLPYVMGLVRQSFERQMGSAGDV